MCWGALVNIVLCIMIAYVICQLYLERNRKARYLTSSISSDVNREKLWVCLGFFFSN